MQKNQNYIRYLTFLAAFGALAYLSTFFKIHLISFLNYEPKDVILILGGMVFGPVFALVLCVLVPFVEMITISSTGIIGFVMNVIAAICFVLPPVLVFHKKKEIKHLILGLILGIIMLTVSMILWNYLLTPIFFGYSRSTVIKMLVPIILPFNLIKGGLNSLFILILYRPIIQGLMKSKILQTSDFNLIKNEKKWTNLVMILIVTVSIILLVLSYFKVV